MFSNELKRILIIVPINTLLVTIGYYINGSTGAMIAAFIALMLSNGFLRIFRKNVYDRQ